MERPVIGQQVEEIKNEERRLNGQSLAALTQALSHPALAQIRKEPVEIKK